jgi:hypothetical protein
VVRRRNLPGPADIARPPDQKLPGRSAVGDAGKSISFDALGGADLHVDAVYESGRSGNAGDDPFPRLLRLSNMGGFRYRGSLAALEMVVLTSSMSDANWPDELDREIGSFTYYGDNKQPGQALHATPRNGNELLRRIFAAAHEGESGRHSVPPIFVFGNTGEWRDVMFLELAVPGTSEQQVAEDLVAIWRTANGMRFQNYRARFTILDAPLVERTWIEEVIARTPHTPRAPKAWTEWVERGRYRPLKSTRSIEYRTKIEQLPCGAEDLAIIREVQQFFRERPHDFEKCAAALARLMLPDIAELDLTRPSRDGGRDAIGKFRLGHGIASILVDFALEAKCYALDNSVGVREMSRLISRLRHRQFRILVTASYVDLHGHADATAVSAWLDREFSAPAAAPWKPD